MYKIPYSTLPDLGALQQGDYVPMLRPPFDEGKAFVSDFKAAISPSKVFRAEMRQSGLDAPEVLTQFENQVGAIAWSYVSTGVYIGNLTGAFAGFVPVQDYVFGIVQFGKTYYYGIEKVDSDNLYLKTYDETLNLSNDMLFNTTVNFYIYV
jgi:hypothetical protein